MKIITAAVLLLSTTIVFSGVAGFLTKDTRDWKFIQSVGGMKISLRENILTVDCNVSGLKKVTVEPTMINSALGVRKLKHKRVGKTIQLSLVTSVLEKGISTSPRPLDLSTYPAGDYSVEYLDPDGATHPLGKITLTPQEQAE